MPLSLFNRFEEFGVSIFVGADLSAGFSKCVRKEARIPILLSVRSQRIGILAVVAILILAVGAASKCRGAILSPRRRLLLAQARKVADTSRWSLPRPREDFEHGFGYHWLSDRTLLFTYTHDDPIVVREYQVLSGKSRIHKRLTRALHGWNPANGISFSPHQRWILLPAYKDPLFVSGCPLYRASTLTSASMP